ncbi:MAG: type II toxin-antitoxin system RelE/ParE family toxin [Candidatus Peribacteraceae bacterium]|nr:type II toxin-antitoxin system RelE/ParE family toxin [Candidatus Peribacteraceae bacterium]
MLIIIDRRVWQKDCARLSKKDLDRVVERISLLAENPLAEGIGVKRLQHYDAADYRLKIGDYRVLFNRNDKAHEIHLLRVLNRSKLY